jgi:CheY-like chemotaxis protein
VPLHVPVQGIEAADAASILHRRPRMQNAAQTVLVVDDSPTSRDILGTILRHGGFAVTEASSVAEAEAAIAAAHPAIVLLDLYLPEVDGFELLRRLRMDPATESLPIVCITAGATAEVRDRALDLGCTELVFKPEGPGEILELVRRVVNRADG